LDELLKGTLEVSTAKKLFVKMRDKFGKMAEEERKIG